MQCSVCDSEFEPTQPHRCLGTLGLGNSPQWTDHWGEFAAQLKGRLEQGHREYGDKSFDLPLGKLVKELQAEVLDIAGWGLILFARLRHLEHTIYGKPQN